MKHIRKTLGELFLSQKSEENEKPENESADQKKDQKKSETEDDEDDDQDDEKQKDDKKKKAPGADQKAEESDDDQADAGTVKLSLDEYNQLFALASETKNTREANVELKKKADQWDAYQAALSGSKPAADSTGADDKKADAGDAEVENLRKKYGVLMDGI